MSFATNPDPEQAETEKLETLKGRYYLRLHIE